MTDKEKIRAEVERRLKLAKKNCIESGWDGYDAQVWVLDDVLSFIDSLPEEANNYMKALVKARDWMASLNQGGQVVLIDIFPELAEKLDPRYSHQESVQKELEEELLNEISKKFFDSGFYEDVYHELRMDMSYEEYQAFARHFSEWGAEHLKRKDNDAE